MDPCPPAPQPLTGHVDGQRCNSHFRGPLGPGFHLQRTGPGFFLWCTLLHPLPYQFSIQAHPGPALGIGLLGLESASARSPPMKPFFREPILAPDKLSLLHFPTDPFSGGQQQAFQCSLSLCAGPLLWSLAQRFSDRNTRMTRGVVRRKRSAF